MSRILLVEDNEMNRDMLSRRLGRRGFDVALAVDGLQGLEAARSGDFDLILMDLSLPGIDGWEAIRRLKADPETRSTPIIALTAHAMAGDRERAVEAGCDDYDIKPIEFPRLVAKIEELLKNPTPPPAPDRSHPVDRDGRGAPNLLRFHLMAPTSRIEGRGRTLAVEARSRGFLDLIDGLESIRGLVARARAAIDLALLCYLDPCRPVDLDSLMPGVLVPAHEIIRVCDALEGSSSRMADRAEILAQLSEVRKDAAQMIALVWQATAGPGRSPA